jgi:hypothetical protein
VEGERRSGDRALHHALARDNALPFVETLLEHGADATLPAPRWESLSAVAVTARLGRGDALDCFEGCGFALEIDGDLAFLAPGSRGDASPRPRARGWRWGWAGMVVALGLDRLVCVPP